MIDMKKTFGGLLTVAALGAAATPAFADAPLYQFDDGTAVSLLCTGTVQFNDNIYLNSFDKDSDVILKLVPGLEVSKGGKESESSLKFVVKEDLSMYMSDDENNYQGTHANLLYTYAGARLNASVAAGFDMNQNTTNRDNRNLAGQPGALVRYYSYYARANGSYKIGEKVSLSSGFSWNGTTYDNHRDSYNDRQTYAIPLSVYHNVLTEKLRAGLSYEFRYSDLSATTVQRKSGLNPGYQQVHFFGVSAVGELTEKLSVDGRIGYTTSDYSRRSEKLGSQDGENTLGFNGAVNYAVTEKTSARLAFNRDFEIAGNGDSITSTGVALSVNHKVDTQWTLNGSVDYRRDDYNDYDRCDDVYTLSAGANYNINDNLGVSATYSFQWDDSNLDSMRYTNNIVTLSLNFRY